MRGSGSGRQRDLWTRDTVEDYRTLDVRKLKRDGSLLPGSDKTITWFQHGHVLGSVDVRAEPGRIILTRHGRDRDGNVNARNYPVCLTTTPCHMGGVRSWFVCPGPGCGRRIAVLCYGNIFACRKCLQVGYQSQKEPLEDRAARRAFRLRKRMGWPLGVDPEWGWDKPKGMHWQTYHRLRREHTILEGIICRAFVGR